MRFKISFPFYLRINSEDDVEALVKAGWTKFSINEAEVVVDGDLEGIETPSSLRRLFEEALEESGGNVEKALDTFERWLECK